MSDIKIQLNSPNQNDERGTGTKYLTGMHTYEKNKEHGMNRMNGMNEMKC